MMHGVAAAVFLGMAIFFMGIAVTTGLLWAWVFVVFNGLGGRSGRASRLHE
jgi:hypothetical protein